MTAASAPRSVEGFIKYWADAAGGEKPNAQSFAMELCDLLGVARPDAAKAEDAANDYVFEKKVAFRDKGAIGFIDLYKRGCFVLEAKQSKKRVTQTPVQAALVLEGGKASARAGGVHRDAPGWDQFMRNARTQAENYARALPADHGWPPFLIIVDVGHVIELYADFTGQGKHYAQFPDRQSYRIALADLAKPEVRERLHAVWTDPRSLDPTRRSAEVTREIADYLARLSKQLEGRLGNALDKTLPPQAKRQQESLIAGKVATFLMRCLFTMFAEDVKLIREDSFLELLRDYTADPAHVHVALAQMWRQMDEGEYSPLLKQQLLKFNGKLFKNAEAIPLNGDELNLLILAAQRSWANVEPAIFGTLLERALGADERHRLGAHYTPRAYVERLVIPTIIEPLTDDWRQVQAEVAKYLEDGESDKAVSAVAAFHTRLCATRVLDPACGTGNFLYVAMELMKRLEGEVLDALQQLGQDQYLLELDRHTVDPHQFLGLEINPRAVEIAELVLWIGYLQWHFRTRGKTMPAEPVLKDFKNITQMDAVLAYDRQDVLRDEDGRVMTRWDGVTTKLHPITGEDVPDPDAQLPIYTYANPRPTKWPEADFIVGNPPFIGGKDLRQELGDGYAEALWKSRPNMPGGADFVTYWWDSAASLVGAGKVRRFGFITTNSITQTFSRRVITRHLDAKKPVSLVYAIPDHPWLKSADRAAVRIAMTVGVAGDREGLLEEVTNEVDLNTDDPKVALSSRLGKLHANLSVGVKLSDIVPLASNGSLAFKGFMPWGSGFWVSPATASATELRKKGPQHLLRYVNGRDLAQKPRNIFALDFYGMSQEELASSFPVSYQHLLTTVKPERDAVKREAYRQNWWIFAEARPGMRQALRSLPRYIATTETSKHRVFMFLGSDVAADQKVRVIASDQAALLAVCSSRHHVSWALRLGGWLGVGGDPVYNNSTIFDPFPFPLIEASSINGRRLSNLGERLDSFRKERLEQHEFLTMTNMYNVRERVREIERGNNARPLDTLEQDIFDAGLIAILNELHDDIDAAVADAYGWPRDLGDEQILERLVALNKERAAEEAKGLIRWLRPEYQMARAGLKRPTQKDAELDLVAGAAKKPKFPTDLPAQFAAVHMALAGESTPVDAATLAKRFAQGGKVKARVDELLRSLVASGSAHTHEGRYFAPR